MNLNTGGKSPSSIPQKNGLRPPDADFYGIGPPGVLLLLEAVFSLGPSQLSAIVAFLITASSLYLDKQMLMLQLEAVFSLVILLLLSR